MCGLRGLAWTGRQACAMSRICCSRKKACVCTSVCFLPCWSMPYDKDAFAVGGIAPDNEVLGLSKQDTEESRLKIHVFSFRVLSVGHAQRDPQCNASVLFVGCGMYTPPTVYLLFLITPISGFLQPDNVYATLVKLLHEPFFSGINSWLSFFAPFGDIFGVEAWLQS